MIKRELYMSKIRPFFGKDVIKVITGIRRSGKSVMLELIKEELIKAGISCQQMITLNFEQMSQTSNLQTAMALHDEILERAKAIDGKIYLFFDEIQEVENWEKCINSLRVELDCDIYITGSNAKLLSGELATYLAGRYVQFVIYPFSFAEFVELYHEAFPEAGISECFNIYLLEGGMPFLSNLNFDEASSQLYLEDLYNSIIYKDILERYTIRNQDMLKRILQYIVSNIGMTFSSTSISKYLKNEGRAVSVETVQNYLNTGINAFFLYRARREDVKGKKILSVNEKYYMADHGIRQALLGTNQKDINLILENIVYMELLRRGYQVTVGKVGDKEIDFIARKREEKIYIQVTYLLANQETIDREFEILNTISNNFPKYVISLDEIDLSRDGIKHRNIKDFLLDETWSQPER